MVAKSLRIDRILRANQHAGPVDEPEPRRSAPAKPAEPAGPANRPNRPNRLNRANAAKHDMSQYAGRRGHPGFRVAASQGAYHRSFGMKNYAFT
jgi:hypothetical protein